MRKNFFIIRCRLKSGTPTRNAQTFELPPKFGKQKNRNTRNKQKTAQRFRPSSPRPKRKFCAERERAAPNARQTREKTITCAVPPVRCPHCTHGAARENLPAPPQKTFPPRRKAPPPFCHRREKCGSPAAFRARGILNADAFGFSSACYPAEFLSNCSFFFKAGHFLVDPSALF